MEKNGFLALYYCSERERDERLSGCAYFAAGHGKRKRAQTTSAARASHTRRRLLCCSERLFFRVPPFLSSGVALPDGQHPTPRLLSGDRVMRGDVGDICEFGVTVKATPFAKT